jgi:hypothetical protein
MYNVHIDKDYVSAIGNNKNKTKIKINGKMARNE